MDQSTELRNLETCRIVVEEIFDGTPDYSKIEECYHREEFCALDAAHGREARFEDLRPMLELYEDAFEGYRSTIVDMIARGDLVFIHWQISGRHTGEFMGYSPTGGEFAIDAMSKCQLKDGKIISVSQIHDLFGLFHQLGLMNQQPVSESMPILNKVDQLKP